MKKNIFSHFRNLILIVIFTNVSLSSSTFGAIDINNATISGTYIGLYNGITPIEERSQFDFATNIDFEFKFSDHVKGIVQLQSGAGNGSLGYVGSGVELTDINLEYSYQNSPTVLTFGSFDLPFGNGVNYLTNNGDAFQSPFIINSLTYSALAGPVGTLNTLGLKAETILSGFNITGSLTNGTGENAANSGNSLQGLISIGKSDIINGLYLGASYTVSDDSDDTATSNSFKTNFSGALVDVNVDLTDDLSFKSHFGQLVYDDKNDNTIDKVAIFQAGVKYQLKRIFYSARVSHWSPEDKNGNSKGISVDISTPGFAVKPIADSSITRYQAGIGYELEKNLLLRSEIFVDKYNHDGDAQGMIMAVNGRF
ncbi:hypothetical protein DID75_04995 [Candidatus Marinamargulisbacteria bacterium SCGC AG-410-N11]|nr:hypothetical protein DID75_04995 [Candidatus Marinamargulisbacteria bacterium SCGC AG-410-N11]